ncbi:helix-turn-helix domain-containing protein [Nocardia abscessus]|uniref:helix-turn-helix domain-containing protein n=1 Tax=Nocardia abscessus TaxID=120957 RepID=UPI002453D83D|nr:helix-turn-helix domain-containing protein [Nocardia abscessus]
MNELELLQALPDTINRLVAENKRLKAENEELRQGRDNRKKLTDREVAEIRRLYRTTGYSQREIAGIYDINPATVSRTVRGIYH